MGVAHLDEVSEDIVVADFERRDTRQFALALLDLLQYVLAVQSDAAQVVELGIDPVGDYAALLNLVVRRIGIDLPFEFQAHLRQHVDLGGEPVEIPVVRRFEDRFEQFDRSERIFQLHQFARRHARGGDTRSDAFQVADQRDLLADGFRQIAVLHEALYHVQPPVDAPDVADRHGYPAFEQTAAHRRERAIHHVCEAAPVARTVGSEEFQVADGELVDPDVVVLVDPRDRCNVADLLVFGEFQIVEDGAGGRNACRDVVDAEPFERLRAELLAELFAVQLLRKDPIVELVGVVVRAESLPEPLVESPLVDDLFGREIRQEFVDVVVRSLGHVEFAGRNVEKGHARGLPAEVNRSQVDVFLVGQKVVAQNDARRNQLDDAPLDESFHQLGVFQLFADRHALPGPHQLGQVGVDGVVGESRQLDEGRRPVGAAGERDAQNPAGLDRIVAERLVEIAHAEEQDRIGVNRLDLVVLLHQRSLYIFLIRTCHNHAIKYTMCSAK